MKAIIQIEYDTDNRGGVWMHWRTLNMEDINLLDIEHYLSLALKNVTKEVQKINLNLPSKWDGTEK